MNSFLQKLLAKKRDQAGIALARTQDLQRAGLGVEVPILHEKKLPRAARA